jgi:hypothetical protein
MDCVHVRHTFNANVSVTNTNPGWFAWADNTVASNVGCSGNVFVANNGAPNTVLGNESGQCSGLQQRTQIRRGGGPEARLPH